MPFAQVKKEVCSAEAGALAPVFEKPATVKPKQKLPKCKSTIHIVIFNLRTLNGIGKQTELIASVVEHDIDIICTQEQILSYQSRNGIRRYWQRMDIHLSICMKQTINAVTGGVGMLLSPDNQTSLNSIKKIQPRMMVAMFNGNPNTTIIFCYSPTNESDETDLISFYNQLSSLIRSIPKHNILIVGKYENNKFCLHNSSNKNGEHLTEFSRENGLTCLNTIFQKRKGKLWTYTYSNNRY